MIFLGWWFQFFLNVQPYLGEDSHVDYLNLTLYVFDMYCMWYKKDSLKMYGLQYACDMYLAISI